MIKRYLLAVCACVCLALAQTCYSQILYTDIVPDTVLITAGGSIRLEYMFDLNRDGTNDYDLSEFKPISEHDPGSIASIASNAASMDAEVLVLPGEMPQRLSFGDAIGPLLGGSWVNTKSPGFERNLTLCAFGDTNSPWCGAVDKYIGLRLKLAGQYRYGWVRLDLSADAATMTIKDYAIEVTPEKTIFAGDNGTTSVDPPETPAVEILAYGDGSDIVVEAPNALREVHQCTVYNILGMPVGRYSLTSSRTRIPMQSAPAGVYFVVVSNARSSVMRKATVW